jgi:hypothetical protein
MISQDSLVCFKTEIVYLWKKTLNYILLLMKVKICFSNLTWINIAKKQAVFKIKRSAS